MTDDEIRKLARFECWRFKESSDPHHSSTYLFNDMCLIDYTRRVIANAALQQQRIILQEQSRKSQK